MNLLFVNLSRDIDNPHVRFQPTLTLSITFKLCAL